MAMRIRHVVKRVAIVAAGCVVIAMLSGAVFEHIARGRAVREHEAPGNLVEVNGRVMQIDCRGSGSPTVVLESGLDNLGSLAWASVHDSIAATTRACAYSRAGIMWSESPDAPFDIDSSAARLHAALISAGESAPWVMVGHSIGGPYITAFTARYPDEVAGLVMVDASHPDQFARFEEATSKSIAPSATAPRIGAALAWTGLVRLVPVPPDPPSWPKVNATASAFLPVSIGALAAELQAVPATLARMNAAKALGDRPLVVLRAGLAQKAEDLKAMGLTGEQGARLLEAHLALGKDMAAWSTRGRLEVVDDATHYIQFDRPDAVIAAVREVVGYVTAHDPAPRRR
jgi:pimeloyl-ACP methyl ester carboxylesterase